VKESRDELAAFFGKFLRGDDNGFENTPRMRLAMLQFGDKDPIYPIVEEEYPIPRTKYTDFFVNQEGSLSLGPPIDSGTISYESELKDRTLKLPNSSIPSQRRQTSRDFPKQCCT
jgi:hypothetical protein